MITTEQTRATNKFDLSLYEKFRSRSGDTNLYGYVLNDPVNFIDPKGTGPISGTICRQLSPYLTRGAFSGVYSYFQDKILELEKEKRKGPCPDPKQNEDIDKQIQSLRAQQLFFSSLAGAVSSVGLDYICLAITYNPELP